MAAYAALNSVMYILRQIQHHPRPPITIQKQQMDSLCENISFLQDFLENYSHRDIGDGKEALVSQIADAAYGAEDVIESYIVDQILADPLKTKRKERRFHAEESSTSDAAYGADDVIESHIVDQILAEESSDEANYGADDVIEPHIVDQILAEKSSDYILFCQDLQKIIEDMNLIKKEAIVIQEKMKGIDDDPMPRNIISMSASIIGSSALPPSTRKHHTNTMVGFDDVFIQIMERLTGYPTNRQVLAFVGMGGIGKTTLARNVHDNPTIAKHFDIRMWVTISQEYRFRDVLLALSRPRNDENKSSENELGDQLYKTLWGRRYLVILDDVWSIEAWEKLMRFLPDNSNGSRIMITTRLSNVSNHFRSHSFKLDFLDEGKSWDLFCKIVFPQDQCCPCPQELDETGKKIARNCKGLPLSIVAIAGLLANSEKTLEKWEYVEKNLNSVVNLEDEQHCLKILLLSYNHLPVHLKPCFLYLGVYPEDEDIRVSRLIKLWVAEGFLKPIDGKTLEMAGREYFNQLIDRNLILVDEWGRSGNVKYCKIHDLLRDLCLREGQKDKFLWVRTVHNLDNLEGIKNHQRRIGIHRGASGEGSEYDNDRVLKVLPSASSARSLILGLENDLLSYSFRLMRVLLNSRGNYFSLKGFQECKYNSLEDIFESVNLRCLFGVLVTCDFPSSIHLLWNLQTLVIINDQTKIQDTKNMVVPPQIWEMSQLRHLDGCVDFSLPDPPNVSLIHEGDDDDLILRNLHTLKTVLNFKLSEEVIKRIPNIKKLGVSYAFNNEGWWHDYCLNNLHLLNELQSLSMTWFYRCLWREDSEIVVPQNFALPRSLKKLTLDNTNLPWEQMRIIGSLPHLQILKLTINSFRGPEWNPVEGEFLCLKFLIIGGCRDLVYWNADSTHFPCLEHLALSSLHNLKEIPLDFGQIPTLRLIDLWCCSKSVVLSAKKLLDEQVELGNEDLQVKVTDGAASLTSRYL